MKTLNEYINESLIYSYDPYRVIKMIKDKFDWFDKNDIFIDENNIDEFVDIKHYKNNKRQCNVICILDFYTEDHKKEIDDYIEKLGWFYSYQKPYNNKRTNFYIPKFQYKINEIIHKENNYLYHYTSKSKQDKILKYGLIPKESHEDSTIKYRNRVHLFKENIPDDKKRKLLNDLFDGFDKDDIIEVKIDISKLDIDFYVDPGCHEFGYITYDNIHPKYIDSIEDYEI